MASVSQPLFDHITKNDALTQLIGALHEEIRPGYARVTLTVRETMLNLHGTTHGGLLSALASIAIGAAANSHGQRTKAVNVNFDFVAPSTAGAELVAEAREISATGSIVLFDVQIHSQNTGELISRGKATLHRSKESLL